MTQPAPYSSNPPYTPLKRNWFSRNWKWAVPVGCLLPILICGGLLTGIGAMVFGMIKSSVPYQHAITTAQSNSAVVASIGSPIKAGFFVTGSINTSGSSGNADLAIPVSGPKGSGTVYVVATESAGVWTYSDLEFEGQNGQPRIPLIASPQSSTTLPAP